MCRVMLANNDAIQEYESFYGLQSLLDFLEEKLGGDGNGYALVKDGKIIKTDKGRKLSNKKIAQELIMVDYDWVIYHTRIKSVGKKSDGNCHPFIRGNWCLGMNGTEFSFGDMADVVELTDTELVFKLISSFDKEDAIDMLDALDSVFVGIFDGSPFALKNSGSLEKYPTMCRNGVMFASEFPKKVITERIGMDYGYIDGVEYPGIQPTFTSETFYPVDSSILNYNFKHLEYNKSTEKPLSGKKISEDKTGMKEESAYQHGYNEGYEAGYDEGYMNAYDERW